MTKKPYVPGPAAGARVEKADDRWTLVLVRELRHPPEAVWRALTDPKELAEWAPFDADRNLAAAGPVTLTTVGAPANGAGSHVTRAEAPRLLEYSWGGNAMRWQLEPSGQGTRLTLWHDIDRRFIAMGAAGWHVCLDVLDQALAGDPIGRLVAGDALKHEGWQRLHQAYAAEFGGQP
jgi:uncharacterized protein YndB with AHSA1/START domain